jgi:hypothetical protein
VNLTVIVRPSWAVPVPNQEPSYGLAEVETVVGLNVGVELAVEHAARSAAKRARIRSILWRGMRAMLVEITSFDKALMN